MSVSGSARVARSRVTTPLTLTWPSAMRRSAPRRLLSPAWARILFSLSFGMLAFRPRHHRNDQLALDPGQIAGVAQAEGDQELARRLVDERTPRRLLAAGDANEPALEQIVEGRLGVDAADGVDLGT